VFVFFSAGSDVFTNLRIVYVCNSTDSLWSKFSVQWFLLWNLFPNKMCLNILLDWITMPSHCRETFRPSQTVAEVRLHMVIMRAHETKKCFSFCDLQSTMYCLQQLWNWHWSFLTEGDVLTGHAAFSMKNSFPHKWSLMHRRIQGGPGAMLPSIFLVHLVILCFEK